MFICFILPAFFYDCYYLAVPCFYYHRNFLLYKIVANADEMRNGSRHSINACSNIQCVGYQTKVG